MAKLATKPGASWPWLAWRPSARAAWRVTPAHASSGVRPNLTQAMFIARCRLAKGLVPGLKSVATAIGTWYLRSSSTGGLRVSLRK
ncbi:Uncharacterised protein [Klebsiella pneumoniae]|uniref:Uncharacterized protein n=1 Tax=Klebsiella pneumoniae TaxID=573 RepID=A0A377TNQ6_KLEPN|nr:Uncharacterised protein [Klebsiella pneumoniae]